MSAGEIWWKMGPLVRAGACGRPVDGSWRGLGPRQRTRGNPRASALGYRRHLQHKQGQPGWFILPCQGWNPM